MGKCKSMTIGENAMIRTHHHSQFTANTLTTNPLLITKHLNNDNVDISSLYGNIQIITEEDLCIAPGVRIQSGNVHLDCKGTLKVNYTTDGTLKESAEITAFRDCLRINALRYYSPFPDNPRLFAARNRLEIESGEKLKEDWDPEGDVIVEVVEGVLEDGFSVQSMTASESTMMSMIGNRLTDEGCRVDSGSEQSDDDETDSEIDVGDLEESEMDDLFRQNSFSYSASSSFKRQNLKIDIRL